MKTYWTLVEPYWDTVSIYDGYDAFLQEFRKIPFASQHLFACHWAQSEIRNGGFDQFFDNSTGVLALEAVEGFKALGMSKTASLLQECIDLLGIPYPHDRENRQDRLSAVNRYFDDMQFWELLRTEEGGFKVVADAYAARAQN